MFVIGTLLLLHAAYSCSHYRELLQQVEESAVDETTLVQLPKLPLDVWVEVIVGFVLLLCSELVRAGSTLRPVVNTPSSNKKHQPLMAPAYVTRDFDIYSTRAKAL